jgi:methyl-accepting chemotaxis protein
MADRLAQSAARRAARIPQGTIDRLTHSGRQLIIQEFAALREALVELAHGNLSAEWTVKGNPLRPEDFPGLESLAEVMNDMLACFRSSAQEFSSAVEPPCHRLCYVGADSFLEGRRCGQAMGKSLAGRGEVAVIHRPGMASQHLRRKGFANALAREFPEARIVHESACPGLSLEEAYEAAATLLRDYPRLSGIYSTQGGVPAGIARAAEEAGRAGQVRIVAHDFADDTMRCVKKGVITAALGQDPYAQGHDPAIHLFNHLVAGWQPPSPRLHTRLELATTDNCDSFWQEGRGNLRPADASQRYARCVDRMPSKPLRIAVLGRSPNPFWNLVKQGFDDAAAALAARNATAEWILPERDERETRVDAEAYGTLIDSVVRQGYHGVAVVVFDAGLVTYINRATRSGTPVVTYNSEPGGLSNMVLLSVEQAGRLMSFSRQLAATIDRINDATKQVKLTMDQVSRATVNQNDQVTNANASIDTLINRIDTVTSEATVGSSLAADAGAASRVGTESVGRTLGSIHSIKDSVSATAQTVERLGKSSEQIDLIVKLIAGIATQIKLLGINAAIEAAHAGSQGTGFSVVAGEIRALGERSRTATKDITNIVESVQREIREALRLMAAELEQVEVGANLAEQAGEALGDIQEAVDTNQGRLKTIAESVAEMHSLSRRVGDVMQALTAITEENSAAAEEVDAAANETLLQVEEVAALAHQLEEMASSTEELLAKFTLAET